MPDKPRSDDELLDILYIAEQAKEEAEKQLERARRFEEVVQNTDEGILQISRDGDVILLANKYFLELSGVGERNEEKILGKSFEMFLPDWVKPFHDKYMKQFWEFPAVRTMGYGNREVTIKKINQTEQTVKIKLVPSQDETFATVYIKKVEASPSKKVKLETPLDLIKSGKLHDALVMLESLTEDGDIHTQIFITMGRLSTLERQMKTSQIDAKDYKLELAKMTKTAISIDEQIKEDQ